MRTSKSFYAMALSLMFAPLSVAADNVTITVENKGNVQRQELVEMPVKDIYGKLGIKQGEPFIVKNALGQQVAYQVTYDGKLLIDASVRPKGSAEFTVEPGVPKPMKTFVCGKQYPERVDDIAWENDRTAYRVYGPALQRTGETIAPSSFNCFMALSTSLRSRPLSSAILPAFNGVPASFIVANTFSFVSIILCFLIVFVSYFQSYINVWPCAIDVVRVQHFRIRTLKNPALAT